MLTVEISLPDVEELQKLVQEGLEKGVLNYDEIAVALDDVELTKEQIEDFYTYLVDHGVELVRPLVAGRLPTDAVVHLVVLLVYAGAGYAIAIMFARRRFSA